MRFRFITLACASWALIACGGRREESAPKPEQATNELVKPQTTATASPPKSNATFKGTIEGSVVLADGASLPRIDSINDGSKFAMVAPPAPCSPLTDDDLTPVSLSESRTLRSIHLALTGMNDYPAPEPRTHDLYISDCRLTPRLVGAAVGDSLRITNRSEVAVLPVFSGESFMQAVLPESSRTIKLEKSGASRLACTFGAFCGRTDVLVTAHPLFAVTDAKGHFVIEKVPLDQDVTVHAWHPLFKDSTATVRLSANEPKRTVELTMTPRSASATPESDASKTPSAATAKDPTAKKRGVAQDKAKKTPAQP